MDSSLLDKRIVNLDEFNVGFYSNLSPLQEISWSFDGRTYTGKPVRYEHYTPDSFGWSGLFSEVNAMYVGDCPGTFDNVHCPPEVSVSGGFARDDLAHTHVCKNDKFYNSICFKGLDYEAQVEGLGLTFAGPTNAEGLPSMVMWHEYGHVLTEYNIECGPLPNQHLLNGKPYNQSDGHGPDWQQTMELLGKGDLAIPYRGRK